MKRVVAYLPLLVCFSTAHGQSLPLDAPLPISGVAYRKNIPLPEQVIGHRIGTTHTRNDQIITYFEALDRASDRVSVADYGVTYEGRRMIYAVVTSPANHKRLAQIKAANRKLHQDPNSVSDAELQKMPGILWMGYNVHGNEASASDAAILFLYHLTAGEGKSIQSALDNLVIVIAPCYNPDGRDRFSNWVVQNRGVNATSDPNDREHFEPWPGGRTNHYWYDLNRDWMPLTQVESSSRHKVWLDFYPQVTTDYHEQSSRATYFFQPGVPTRVHPLTPKSNQQWTEAIGQYHAKALEALGEFYFTEERFDDFYIGKGSTYPDVCGSIGILFEQASTRGLQTTTDTRLLTFAITIRNQVATCLSTLEATVDNRVKLLEYQRDFFRDSLAGKGVENWTGIELSGDGDRLGRLCSIFAQHEIQFFRNQNVVRIPMKQPKARLIQAMFERRFKFEDDQFYDISAWSLDLAFDLKIRFMTEAFQGENQPEPKTDFFTAPAFKETYVYSAEWGKEGSPALLYEVLNAGGHALIIRTAPKGVDMPLGTLVFPTEGPLGERLEKILQASATRNRVKVRGWKRGAQGIVSLGGNATVFLEKPKVALVVGTGADANNSGEIWQLLDQHWGIPVSLINSSDARNLSSYNTIILAGGSYSADLATALTPWVNQGGRLIATTSAVDWVSAREIWKLESRVFRPDLTKLKFGELYDERGRHALPGAIFEAEFDTTHPLAYGLSETMPVFRDSNVFYTPPNTPGTTVARYTKTPILAGYASPEVAETIQQGAAVLAKRSGQGSIILIMDNPHFRAFFIGPNRLLANAVFFGGSFQP